MVEMKTFLLVLLCGVLGPLAVSGAELGKKSFGDVIEKPNLNSRLDASVEPTTLITVVNDQPESFLFRNCRIQANSAIVRFRELSTESGEVFKRYVASNDQLNQYNPVWVPASFLYRIKTIQECASYADKQGAMMFKFDGTECQVSFTRLPMSSPNCGDRTADAIFVSTSCAEPAVSSVTVTPRSKSLEVSWTSVDSCSLALGYRITWAGGASPATTNSSATSYLIEGLSPCQSLSVTVEAYDSTGAPYGDGMTNTGEALSEDPVVATVTITANVDSLDVSWTAVDPCSLASGYSVSWDDNTMNDITDNSTTSYLIEGLSPCQDQSVSVVAIGQDGSAYGAALTEDSRTSDQDPAVATVTITANVDSLDVSWTAVDPCSLASWYFVSWDDAMNDITDNSTTSYLIEGLSPCQDQSVSVVAIRQDNTTYGAALTEDSRTSDQDPAVATVTITANVDSLDVSWTAVDPCSLASGYSVSWDDAMNDITDNSTTSYLIEGLGPCQDQSVSVVAIRQDGSAYGAALTEDSRTSDQVPVVRNIAVTATGLVTYAVSWELDDPCGLADSLELTYTVDGVAVTTEAKAKEDTTTTIILDDCTGLEVTVAVKDVASNELSSASSDPSSPLYTTDCETEFTPLCSGCLYTSGTASKFSQALSTCSGLNGASLLSVSSSEELAALRAYLTKYATGAGIFWVDLTEDAGVWTWGTNYVQPTPDDDDWITGQPDTTGGNACGYIDSLALFKLGDSKCQGNGSNERGIVCVA